jgi:hypothetical protein
MVPIALYTKPLGLVGCFVHLATILAGVGKQAVNGGGL